MFHSALSLICYMFSSSGILMFVCLLHVYPELFNEVMVEYVARGCACHDILDKEERKPLVPESCPICCIWYREFV